MDREALYASPGPGAIFCCAAGGGAKMRGENAGLKERGGRGSFLAFMFLENL